MDHWKPMKNTRVDWKGGNLLLLSTKFGCTALDFSRDGIRCILCYMTNLLRSGTTNVNHGCPHHTNVTWYKLSIISPYDMLLNLGCSPPTHSTERPKLNKCLMISRIPTYFPNYSIRGKLKGRRIRC